VSDLPPAVASLRGSSSYSGPRPTGVSNSYSLLTLPEIGASEGKNAESGMGAILQTTSLLIFITSSLGLY